MTEIFFGLSPKIDFFELLDFIGRFTVMKVRKIENIKKNSSSYTIIVLPYFPTKRWRNESSIQRKPFSFCTVAILMMVYNFVDAVEFQMSFDRRSGRPIAVDLMRVDVNSVSCEVLSEERYIGSVVQEAKPPKQKNVSYRTVWTVCIGTASNNYSCGCPYV